jgi:Uma2 family endonuclease
MRFCANARNVHAALAILCFARGWLMSTTSDWTALPQTVSPPVLLQPTLPAHWTVADLQQHLGGVPADRIRLFPFPGTATEEDALRIDAHEDRICELVDGILVEKPMAYYESVLAGILITLINNYLETNNRGIAAGADGALWILPRKMRIPDVSFISWERFPGRKLPNDKIFRVAPDLAVEILSDSNTEGEMNLKLDEYFRAGVRLVWYIDPHLRTACIYTARDEMRTIDEQGVLDGQDVLPGFHLRLGELFDRVTRPTESAK